MLINLIANFFSISFPYTLPPVGCVKAFQLPCTEDCQFCFPDITVEQKVLYQSGISPKMNWEWVTVSQ